jgi:hypothetical protein
LDRPGDLVKDEKTFTRETPMPVGSIVARNLMDGVTVLASDVKGTYSVEWAASGSPTGDDVQYIPEPVLESVAFKRALARGVVELIEDESDPEVVEALSRQVDAFKRRQAGAQEEVKATIDRPTNRDHVSTWCVGPDNRGTGTCGEAVAISEKLLKDVPPLCPKHKGLGNQYVPEVDTSGAEAQTKWIRVSLGSRERN